jgi:thiosulfate/3-mercaptopyruvate sulfurtransferase
MYTTVIRAAELLALPTRPVLLDCRFKLGAADADYGRSAYAAGHLLGAHYLHLDQHLSSAKTGRNGRHPLPERAALVELFGSLGIGPDTQVVAYDDAGGMFAARAWWLLRWLGHEAVAVLDGGVNAWLEAGGALTQDVSPVAPVAFVERPSLGATVDAAAVQANLAAPVFTVVDARAPDRFRGENETMDPVGGHIPGAKNRFFMQNLNEHGRFKSPEELAQQWVALLGRRDDWSSIVHQCGSGVTACVNLLAMEHAGFSGSRLYPGSWSEWCSDPARPVASGS